MYNEKSSEHNENVRIAKCTVYSNTFEYENFHDFSCNCKSFPMNYLKPFYNLYI